ncbi:MAG: hypothetical protein ACLU0O_07215 [Collinsella sp.]
MSETLSPNEEIASVFVDAILPPAACRCRCPSPRTLRSSVITSISPTASPSRRPGCQSQTLGR